MSNKIKLIWDFRGPSAERTAAHHKIHLEEFCQKENHQHIEIGTKEIQADYSLAYMVVPKEDMILFRDALRPHRGETTKE